MIKIYTQEEQGKRWLARYRECSPIFVCVLGFTSTGLIPGISAAGATPESRQYTAIADAEFLVNGFSPNPKYPLPPLTEGVSPVFITRAILESLKIPIYLFNAGLPHPPAVSAIDLGGLPAQCLTTGAALPREIVQHLFSQGLKWGEILAKEATNSYLILGECVVGGTTTALAILTGLGFDAVGMVNSSHPSCNHAQKWSVVQQGLEKLSLPLDPFSLLASVGDPMQIVVAGMAIAASRSVGVMLGGGTQMLAVYALLRAIIDYLGERANLEEIVVGTTRWVAEDRTGDTRGLAKIIGEIPLLGTQLSFANSRYPNLQVYEQGFVKEGVGAGGCAIAAHLYQNWTKSDLLTAIENLVNEQ
jgi:uncharacterized protein (TIGR00303 family)